MNNKFFFTEQQDLILDLHNINVIFDLNILLYIFCKELLPSVSLLILICEHKGDLDQQLI
jgi:hypothetical protein